MPEKRELHLNEIPKQIILSEYTFELLCTTLHQPGHYFSVVKINEDQYVMNDLVKQVLIFLPPADLLSRQDKILRKTYNLPVSTAFYYLKMQN